MTHTGHLNTYNNMFVTGSDYVERVRDYALRNFAIDYAGHAYGVLSQKEMFGQDHFELSCMVVRCAKGFMEKYEKAELQNKYQFLWLHPDFENAMAFSLIAISYWSECNFNGTLCNLETGLLPKERAKSVRAAYYELLELLKRIFHNFDGLDLGEAIDYLDNTFHKVKMYKRTSERLNKLFQALSFMSGRLGCIAKSVHRCERHEDVIFALRQQAQIGRLSAQLNEAMANRLEPLAQEEQAKREALRTMGRQIITELGRQVVKQSKSENNQTEVTLHLEHSSSRQLVFDKLDNERKVMITLTVQETSSSLTDIALDERYLFHQLRLFDCLWGLSERYAALDSSRPKAPIESGESLAGRKVSLKVRKSCYQIISWKISLS